MSKLRQIKAKRINYLTQRDSITQPSNPQTLYKTKRMKPQPESATLSSWQRVRKSMAEDGEGEEDGTCEGIPFSGTEISFAMGGDAIGTPALPKSLQHNTLLYPCPCAHIMDLRHSSRQFSLTAKFEDED